jgi:hypothetical protein
MTASPFPWFKFHLHYFSDWRITGGGDAVVAGFLRAMAALWANPACSLPADPVAFARAIQCHSQEAAAAVLAVMAPHPTLPGAVTLPALMEEWEEANATRAKRAIAGKASATAKATCVQQVFNTCSTHVEQEPNASPTHVQQVFNTSPTGVEHEPNTCSTHVDRVRERVREEREEVKASDDARKRAPAREERTTEPPPLASRPTNDDEGKKNPIVSKPTATAPPKPAPPPVSLWDDDEEEPEPTPPPPKLLNGSARMRAEEDARLDALLAASEAMPRLSAEPAKAAPAPVLDLPAAAGTTGHAADARRIVEAFASRHRIVEGDRDVARRVAAAEEAIGKHGLDRFEAAIAWWESVGRTEEAQSWKSILLYPDGLAPTEKCDRVELALARIDKAAGRKPGKAPIAAVGKTFAEPARVEAI